MGMWDINGRTNDAQASFRPEENPTTLYLAKPRVDPESYLAAAVFYSNIQSTLMCSLHTKPSAGNGFQARFDSSRLVVLSCINRYFLLRRTRRSLTFYGRKHRG